MLGPTVKIKYNSLGIEIQRCGTLNIHKNEGKRKSAPNRPCNSYRRPTVL
jgi:hypothetical protein